MRKEGLVEVSVIVPVFNVEKYLDQCVESLVGQTYGNIEIVLIDDGSTDRSAEICSKWVKMDSRVRYIYQNNSGAGRGRNKGMECSTGKYIVFVDSDDWVTDDCIGQLYKRMECDCLDVCFFEYYRYIDGVSTRVRQCDFDCYDEDFWDKLMIYGSVAVNKMYRRDFLTRNGLHIPELRFEDIAMFPGIVLARPKVGFIQKPLYYYRRREDSTSRTWENYREYTAALKYCLTKFRESGGGDSDAAVLEMYIVKRCLTAFSMFPADWQQEMKPFYYRFLDTEIPGWRDKYQKKWLLFGSYLINWCLQKTVMSKHSIALHVGFSSLISQFLGDSRGDGWTVKHGNAMRRAMVKQDVSGKLSTMEPNELEEFDGIVMDFLEERNNVLQTVDGVFLTESEAYADAEVAGLEIEKTIYYGTDGFLKLWKKACDRFIEFLNQNFMEKRVVLIQSRLATKFEGGGQGRTLCEFEDIECINRKNKMISVMEQYFLDRYGRADVDIIALPSKYLYTGEDNRYGWTPNNLNGKMYEEVGWELNKLLST